MNRELERIIWSASAQNRPVHIGHIRSYCRYDFQVVDAWKLAKRLGVRVLGQLKYSEQQILVGPNPRAERI